MLKLAMCIDDKGKYGEFGYLTKGKVYEVVNDKTETSGIITVIANNNEQWDYPRRCFGERIAELTDEEVESFREACRKILSANK